MRAAWYESQGEARNVLVVGTMEDPLPGPGEVRIAVQRSGINPGDVKKRIDTFGVGMSYPRVIPHSDGSGTVDIEGDGVSSGLLGERVWCFGAQSYRPFGTAAEFAVVPLERVMRLPSTTSWDQGACLGIPGITAHRAVHVGGDVKGRVVLVQGGAGAVGMAAVAIARHAGARVIATVRSEADSAVARGAGASEVLRTDGLSPDEVVESVLALASDGVDHIVEVAFQANVAVDDRVLKLGGSIASYATNRSNPEIPFWNLVFKNARLYFLGSDDFPAEAKRRAAADLSDMLAHGWVGYPIRRVFPLDEIANAHELVEQGSPRGRVLLDLTGGAYQQGNEPDGRLRRPQVVAKR
jgi:NADPH2:quinone reductase